MGNINAFEFWKDSLQQFCYPYLRSVKHRKDFDCKLKKSLKIITSCTFITGESLGWLTFLESLI